LTKQSLKSGNLSRDDRWFLVLWISTMSLALAILGTNIYDSFYPPLFRPPKIDIVQVKRRIKETGLIPREARYYRIIDKDSRGDIREVERRK